MHKVFERKDIKEDQEHEEYQAIDTDNPSSSGRTDVIQYKAVANNKFEYHKSIKSNQQHYSRERVVGRGCTVVKFSHRHQQGKRGIVSKNAEVPMSPIIF
jgi:hypothetical protein